MQLLRHAARSSETPKSSSPHHWIQHIIPHAFAWLATTVYGMTGDRRGWLPIFVRTSAHLAVITVAILAVGLSNAEWPAQAAISSPTRTPLIPAETGENAETERSTNAVLVKRNGLNGNASASNGINVHSRAVVRIAQPYTIVPNRPRLGVITYTVQAGDTVQAIAEAFDLQATTIMWADSAIEDAPDLLRIDQEVTILPVDGVYHKVKSGDTLKSIAEAYKVEAEAIIACEYNHLESPDSTLAEGLFLIVPGGEKPYVPKIVTTYTGSVPEGARGTGRFQWPVLGSITQDYWYGHRAIDIGSATGSALLAADGGFISFAGWTDIGYGYLVVIDHANGFATYYAHLSNIYVSSGQAVERGQVIGAVGSTGWSTGPHLHFEVRYYGTQQNPRVYLP